MRAFFTADFDLIFFLCLPNLALLGEFQHAGQERNTITYSAAISACDRAAHLLERALALTGRSPRGRRPRPRRRPRTLISAA